MKKRLFIPLVIYLCFAAGISQAWSLSATAAVEKQEVFIGESFVFQVQVSGSENPEKPDLSHVEDFTVVFQGGQQNSSRSVTIVNGRVVQDVKEGYFFSYQLTPRRTGRLVIPSIIVRADGNTTRTESIIITAKKPVETDDFKLRLELSKSHCYVGEPVTLTVTWYIGKDVQDFNFTLPVINDDTFAFADPKVDTRSGKKLYRIRLGDQEVLGEKSQGKIDNREYATITFKKILIPKQAGPVTIEPATVACNALVGYKKQRRGFNNDFFSDFFKDDFFGRGQRGVYKTIVVPSNPLELKVLDLPEEGRPHNYSGHVGQYEIQAAATPTEVNVGDPITLTISLSGPEYLENVRLPALGRQTDMVKMFKIPKERASGEISGQKKVFTQTIRALSPDVREIPAIELPYFDTRSQKYRVARTQPIPVNVKKTRIITALDAEGMDAQQMVSGAEIESWSQGIAFNYEDMGAIKNQHAGFVSGLRSLLWISLIVGPPFLYGILFCSLVISRRKNADLAGLKAKKAYKILVKNLREAEDKDSSHKIAIAVLEAFRQYLGDKLGMPKGALTFKDVKTPLADKGFTEETLARLKDLFEKCEASSYAGDADLSATGSVNPEALELAKDLEKKLK